MQLGAQMFTVREHTTNLDDFAATLQKIADIGYKTVQVSGTCEYEGEWLSEQLKKTGLKCVITHYSADKMLEDAQSVINLHKIFDCHRIGLGYYDLKENTVQQLAEKFLPVAKNFKQNGCKLYYHNHNFEFRKENGITIMEALCNAMPKELLGITFDTYWAQKAGADPALFINKFAGRVDCVHFKDMDYEANMSVVGEGNMNFERIITACESAGTKYILVEQDDCRGEDPFECLKRSYKNLRAMGLE